MSIGGPCGPARSGTIGILYPGLEGRLVDPLTGRDVPTNTAGELWLRGPTIMKGYLKNETETRAALTPDGWFKTGDKVSGVYLCEVCFEEKAGRLSVSASNSRASESGSTFILTRIDPNRSRWTNVLCG